MDIHYGMAGFAYEKWRKEGVFYPQSARTADEKLSYYASSFNSLTMCLTYSYNPPKSLFISWVDLCKSQNSAFVFNVYAPHDFTDSKSISSSLSVWTEFWNGKINEFNEETGGCRYLHEKNALGCLILRFCPGFDYNPKNMNKILKITKKIPKDVKLAFIFLHTSWYCMETRDVFRKKNWCIATSYVTNNLIDAGSFGNLKSTKTTQKPVIEKTSDFVYVALNGSYGPELGSYDKNGFLENLASEIKKTSGTKEIFCSFDNTSETTYKYPLPGLLISGYWVCPKMSELPTDSDGIDRQCCLHDALKMKKLLETYQIDSEGFVKIKFLKK